MEYTEVKLIAVWSGPQAPPSQLKLSDYKLPVAGRMPKNYFNALYGNRNAYMALGELLAQAQKSGHYFSTATITVGIETPRKPGVVHLEDIGEETGAQFVNLSRVSKEVVSEVADIYRTCSAFKNLPDDEVDWRKPFRFMPECPEHLPVVFDLLQCSVLVHPVAFTTTPEGKHHFIASFDPERITILDAQPNRHEIGPHPDKIIL
ncbi:hypothetical protein [uncultured Limnobacter sp.]|uniref:hypothetical protein n=1 Tax=uncultured Limnobacter sp. TaxID=199681 RepID=UPI0030F7ADD7